MMALDTIDVDLDGVTSEKVPLEIEKLVRRFNDSSVVDTGVDDSSENPPVNAIVDMGAFEAPRCLLTTCNDFDWCTADTCTDSVCANECVERCYGNVNHSSPTQVNLDDVLAVMNCFGGGCANCGPNGTGTVTGCDIANGSGCPSTCGSDGVIDLQDIIAVLAAFSNCTATCPGCCTGEGLMAGGGGVGNLGVAEEVIYYLATKEAEDSQGEDLHRLLADAFTLFVQRDYTEEEQASVVEMLTNAQANTEDSLALELLSEIAHKLEA